MIAAIAGGATTAPTAVPALMMPIAVERSRGREPLGHDLGRGRKAAALADAEQKAARGQHPEAGRKAVAGARERPEDHDDEKAAPRAQPIDQRAAAGVHEARTPAGRSS